MTEKTLPYEKGVDIPRENFLETWTFVVKTGREILEDSNFVNDGDITSKDIEKLKNFFESVYLFQKEKFGEERTVFNESLREHLLLTEKVSELMAQELGLDPDLQRALGLFHDLGRIISHRRGVNDEYEFDLARDIGIRESFLELLPPDSLWAETDEEKVNEELNKMTERRGGVSAAIILSDVLAKWKDRKSGKLRDWEDVVPLTNARQKSPDESKMWPAELSRQKVITSEKGARYVRTKYTKLKTWFEEKTGTPMNDFIKKVEEFLTKSPIPDSWTVLN